MGGIFLGRMGWGMFVSLAMFLLFGAVYESLPLKYQLPVFWDVLVADTILLPITTAVVLILINWVAKQI